MSPVSIARALLLTAAVIATAPAAATAAPPSWTATQQLSTAGEVAGQGIAVLGTDDRILAGWFQIDGSNRRLRVRVRDANGTWGAAEWLSPAGQDVGDNAQVQANRDGSFSVIWNAGNETEVDTLLSGETEWDSWSLNDMVPQTDGVYGGTATALAGGSSALAFIRQESGDNDVVIARRAAGTATWSVENTIHEGALNIWSTQVSSNDSGELAVFWSYSTGGGDQGVRAKRCGSDGVCSGVTEALAATAGVNKVAGAISSGGALVVVWSDGDVHINQSGQPTAENSVYATVAAPGTVNWSTPERLTPASGAAVIIPALTPDNDDNVVLTYQQYNDQGGYYIPSPTARAYNGASNTWDSAQAVTPFGGAPMPWRNAHGDISLAYIGSDDNGATLKAGLAVRESGASGWSDRGLITTSTVNVQFGTPSGTLTDDLDGLVVYPHGTMGDPAVHSAFAVSDASGPRLDGIAVPSSAETGQQIDVSVDPFDLFSSVAAVTWTFGDGSGAETGSSTAHAYRAAGTYTVTITASDLQGHSTSATRQVTVTDAAADPPPAPPAPPADAPAADDEDTVVEDVKPPAIAAPVIEARLAGRIITFNAKLTLKRGQVCSGKVSATVVFGGKRYRTNLKLATAGGACRATGRTTLKKTPSLRTKLRVTVSGGQVKSRTLTTRRG
ncbi:MAG: PKD domain-containing protein [Baekduia sp.]